MSIYRKLGGSVYEPVSIYRKLGGTVHPIREVWRKHGGTVHLVWSALSASAAPTFVSAPSPGPTPSVTVTVDGGAAPFSYLWELVSGGMLPTSPASATTTFNTAFGDPGTGVLRCRVEDANGAVAFTNEITATIT